MKSIAIVCVLSASMAASTLIIVACPAPSSHGEGEGEGAAGEGEGASTGEGEGEGAGACTNNGALLGSLAVGDHFLLVGGQGIPDTILTVGVSDLGDGSTPPELIGLTNDLHVVDLGTYPGSTPSLPPTLFDALSTADAGLSRNGTDAAVFPSFLLVDRALIATGYTRTADFGGNLAGFNLSDQAAGASYIDAPANFSATALGDNIVVEAGGLGSAQSGPGVYASAAGAESFLFGLGASAVGSGNVTTTKSGVLVVGRFTSANELFAIPSATATAIAGGTGTFDMETATPFFSGSLNGVDWGVARFGDGVGFVDVDASFTGVSVSHVALTDGATVTAGAQDDVVTGGSAACTTVSFVASFQDHLLVGVHDAAGQRIVEIQAR